MSDGKQAVGAKVEPSELKALKEWEAATGSPASASEGNAFIDGFRAGAAQIANADCPVVTRDKAMGAKVEEIVKKHGLWNPIYNRDDAGVLTTKAAIVLALEEAYDAGAAQIARHSAAPTEPINIPFEESPCGHPGQYAYTEDGGKHIVCLLCEYREGHSAAEPSECGQIFRDQFNQRARCTRLTGHLDEHVGIRIAEGHAQAPAQTVGAVTHEQALKSAQRFIDEHFNNEGKEFPQTRIPADPTDDDILLTTYIRQQMTSVPPAAPAQQLDKLAQRIADFWICSQLYSETWRREKIVEILNEELWQPLPAPPSAGTELKSLSQESKAASDERILRGEPGPSLGPLQGKTLMPATSLSAGTEKESEEKEKP